MKAILLVSHGSHSPETIKEVESLVAQLKSLTQITVVCYAFLEIASPSIEEGIKQCIKEGATEVVVLLNFLNSGRHVNKDIPSIVESARKTFPHVEIKLTAPVGQHPQIAGLFVDLIKNTFS